MNIPMKTKNPKNTNKKKKGRVGDSIRFSRRNIMIDGVIHAMKDNVAIVEIGLEDSLDLNLENQLTVVAHKNYEVL